MTEGWRTPQQREMDGILYSSAWRRLRGVTQVMPITGGVSKTHDRMTHSLKVAQVGMRFAQYLRFNNENSELIIPEAVYVAGMAHDLGHPPFGHIAENELQRILTRETYKWRLADSFEGNAQTFRILTRLAKKRNEPPEGGLGLTVESLAACTKHPWAYRQAKTVIGEDAYKRNPSYFDRKWGYYNSDKEAWQRVLDADLYAEIGYSPNAKLMDIADDVTFAFHDILDYFRRHLIPLHEIGAGLRKEAKGESERNKEYERFDAYAMNSLTIAKDLNTTVRNKTAAKAWLGELNYPGARYSDTDEERRALHNFETEAVLAVQGSLKIVRGLPQIPDEVRLALEYLKELTWFYVINHPHLSASQMGQRRIIRELHEWICLWVESAQSNEGDYKDERDERDLRRLPGRLQSLLQSSKDSENTEEARISRAVVDFISSLTDAEAVSLHRQLGGINPAVEEVSWL